MITPNLSSANDEKPQQPAHPADRAQHWVIALIAASAALLGSAIGVGGSVIAADITNNGFDHRTQRDFLHSQQVTALATYIGDVNALLQAEQLLELTYPVSAIDTRHAHPSANQLSAARVGKAVTTLEATRTKVDTDDARAVLVSSFAVVGQVETTTSYADEVTADGTAHYLCDLYPGLGKSFCEGNEKRRAKEEAALSKAVAKLSTMGREELDAPTH